MVQFATILANRGDFYHPRIGKKLVDPISNEVTILSSKKDEVVGIRDAVWDIILEGMREVVDGGTGWRAGIYGIPGAGKTGTAQNPHGESHAWFIGIAPFENPEIAICVLIENGGAGGSVAAPIAGAYMKKYFYYQGRYDYAIEKILLAQAAKKDSLTSDTTSIENIIIEDTVAQSN